MRRSWFGVAAAGAMAATTIGMACLDASVPRASAARRSAGAGRTRPSGRCRSGSRRDGRRSGSTPSETRRSGAASLRLHEAIEGKAHGGVGDGVSPRTALAVGLKVDVDALPKEVVDALQAGQGGPRRSGHDAPPPEAERGRRPDRLPGRPGRAQVDRDPVRPLPLDGGRLVRARHRSPARRLGEPGPERRRDREPLARPVRRWRRSFGSSEPTVRDVLKSWGPGKFDAELFLDGKAFRPDGATAATLIPPAFGLAGVNLHTFTGWGSVTHWNAFVANLEMHGKGTFFDPRLDDAAKFPIAAANGFGHVPERPRPRHPEARGPAPLPARDRRRRSRRRAASTQAAAKRGEALFGGQAKCAQCHVPPLFTEPGWNMHTAEEIGIDDFQASRSPDGRYRTTPLPGLWTHQEGRLLPRRSVRDAARRRGPLRRPPRSSASPTRRRPTSSST